MNPQSAAHGDYRQTDQSQIFHVTRETVGRGDVSGAVMADVTQTWANAAFVGGAVAIAGLGAYTLYAMNVAEQIAMVQQWQAASKSLFFGGVAWLS